MRLSTRLVCLAMAIWAVSTVYAQDLHAIAEDGRKVLLAPDGKWRFDTDAAAVSGRVTYQSSVKNFSVVYDSANWKPMPAKDGEPPSKRVFLHKTLPIYAMVIADAIPVSTADVKNFIVANARAGGAEPTVVSDKHIDISGHSVGALQFSIAPKGVALEFLAYYFGSPAGNVQVSCYTAQTLFAKYEGECQKFMGGLAIQ